MLISRGGREAAGPRSVFERRNDLPYGLWTCHDGREVLFNRWYEPLWHRTAGGSPQPADPKEWVASIARQQWFYDDGHREPQKRAHALAALDGWGIPHPEKPRARKRETQIEREARQ